MTILQRNVFNTFIYNNVVTWNKKIVIEKKKKKQQKQCYVNTCKSRRSQISFTLHLVSLKNKKKKKNKKKVRQKYTKMYKKDKKKKKYKATMSCRYRRKWRISIEETVHPHLHICTRSDILKCRRST